MPALPCISQHDLPWSPNMREAIGGLPPLPLDHPTNKYGWEEMQMPQGETRSIHGAAVLSRYGRGGMLGLS